MVPLGSDADRLAVSKGFAGGTVLGKRYADPTGKIELLATRAGAGSLAIDGTSLVMRGARPLPSSD